jgi:hypothetical protein
MPLVIAMVTVLNLLVVVVVVVVAAAGGCKWTTDTCVVVAFSGRALIVEVIRD